MKKIITLTLLLISALFSNAQYDHLNINFLSLFDDSTVVPEQVYGIRYQACWGWADPNNGKEYGIIGSTAGTYIIEVTDPVNPVQRDYIPHRQSDCIWHEYKTYQNYLYIISDDGGNNSLQIADLSYLPDSVNVIYDSTDIFVHAHTLFIDGDKLYVGSVSTDVDFSAMNVYSLANPAHPTLLRRLDQDYSNVGHVHDMFVMNDTVYASCGYQGMFIYKYDSIANQFIQLGSLQDVGHNYNHSSFLSPDHQTLYVCEEVPPGLPVMIVDVHDIANPSLVDTFYSNAGATPHNPVVFNNSLLVAYYQDGVMAYDLSDPHAPALTGYFDTYPANPPGTYNQPDDAGCWSVYADLPSGILLAGDMQSGLFCLDIDAINGIKDLAKDDIKIYPNPASNQIRIKGGNKCSIQLLDLSGKEIWKSEKSNGDISIDVSDFAPGVYVVRLLDDEKIISKKVIITRN